MFLLFDCLAFGVLDSRKAVWDSWTLFGSMCVDVHSHLGHIKAGLARWPV